MKTILQQIKDFEDILFGYGDDNLLREYRKTFGFSYNRTDCEHDYKEIEGSLVCKKCGDLITKSMMYRQNIIDRVKFLLEVKDTKK